MTTYLPRSAWTSTAASGSALSGGKLRGVAVHWPGTTQDRIGDPGRDAIADKIRSYRDYHVNTRGWRDIGYNFAIDQGGRVWMCRSTAWRGNLVGSHCASAANPDANEEYVGMLLILGDRERPSEKMIRAFQDWYNDRFLPGWPNRTDVRPHKRVPGAQTDCCGPYATALIDDGTLTAKPTTEDDMPYSDWPLADRRALARDVAEAVADRPYANNVTGGKSRFAWLVRRIHEFTYGQPERVWSRRLPWYGSWNNHEAAEERFPDGLTAQAHLVHAHRIAREAWAEASAFYALALQKLEELKVGGVLTEEQRQKLADDFAARVKDELDNLDITVNVSFADAVPAPESP